MPPDRKPAPAPLSYRQHLTLAQIVDGGRPDDCEQAAELVRLQLAQRVSRGVYQATDAGREMHATWTARGSRRPGRPAGSADPDRDAAIVRAVEAGGSHRKVAAAFGLTRQRVDKIVRRARAAPG